MSENTKIEWCDDTHNFWRGCDKVSPGCTHCYAEALVTSRLANLHYEAATAGGKNTSKQFFPTSGGYATSGMNLWGKGAPRIRSVDFDAPLRWNKKPWVCDLCGTPSAANRRDNGSCINSECDYHKGKHGSFHRRRVFSLSLGDWLDDERPIEWLADMLRVIHRCPDLYFLLLTKRPGDFKGQLHRVNLSQPAVGFDEALVDMVSGWIDGFAPPNVWPGVSMEDQPRADERISEVLRIPAAAVRFLSVEPLLGPVDLAYSCFNGADSFGTMPGIHWVIVGGESGKDARPCNVEWIRDIVRQCKQAGVPCFVKQLGANVFYEEGSQRKRWLLDHRKGGDPDEWPEDLRVREFPK